MGQGMAAGGIMQGAGAAMHIYGTYLNAKAAKKRRKELEQIANTAGLDLEGISASALESQGRNLPAASALSSQEATSRQTLINQLLEQSLPGFTATRDQALGSASDLIAGNIPLDVSQALQRNAAARSLGGGYGGSGMHRNLVGRDLGLTSLNMKSKGLEWLAALRGLSPVATPTNALTLAGPNANEAIGIRGSERSQRMQMLAAAQGLPMSSEVWGDNLHWGGANLIGQGSQMMGTGGGGGASGGGGMSGMGSPGQGAGANGGGMSFGTQMV